jgi:hypothetical protein
MGAVECCRKWGAGGFIYVRRRTEFRGLGCTIALSIDNSTIGGTSESAHSHCQRRAIVPHGTI